MPDGPGKRRPLRELIAEFRALQSRMDDDEAMRAASQTPESIASWNAAVDSAYGAGREASARLGVAYNDFVDGAPIGVWKDAPESEDEPFTTRDPSWAFGKTTRRRESLIPPARPPEQAPHRPFENNRDSPRFRQKDRDLDT